MRSSAKPRLLDLFCGAGGIAAGFAKAGFEVVGVDIEPQPLYPFEFWQMDALDAWPMFADFDALHASPPCQAWTRARRFGRGREDHPQLIGPTRDLFARSERPWSIENVAGTGGELRGCVRLCGSMFGLLNLHAENGGSSVSSTYGTFSDRHEESPTFTGYGMAAWVFGNRLASTSAPRRRPWFRRGGDEVGDHDGG